MRATTYPNGWRPRWFERIAPDFQLLDVWEMPVKGGREEFDDLLAILASFDPESSDSRTSRLLFAARRRLGSWFGWDEPHDRPIPGCAETTLRARLPDELAGSAETFEAFASSAGHAEADFQPLYRTDEEAAIEISNATVHGVLLVSWIPTRGHHHLGYLSVYVKARGILGQVYLRAIGPFRHMIVYPALMQEIGAAWDTRPGRPSASDDPY